MSRSYRKYPLLRVEKEDYRILNRQLRRDKLAKIPKGSSFKRHRPHWNYWAYVWTWEQAKKEYYELRYRIHERYTLEEWYQYWARCVRRK